VGDANEGRPSDLEPMSAPGAIRTKGLALCESLKAGSHNFRSGLKASLLFLVPLIAYAVHNDAQENPTQV
jgi:hypothetical protein